MLFLGRSPGLLAMLGAYLDASGKTSDINQPGRPALAVAGFLAKVEQWKHFCSDWRTILDQHGVSVGHMKEFAHRKGDFKDWPESQRRRYIEQCAGILKVRVLTGHVTAVSLKDYEKIAQENGLHQSAFFYAVVHTMAQLNGWRARYAPDEMIAHIFERGDGHEDELFRADKEINAKPWLRAKTGSYSITLMSKHDDGAEPLQASDMLAYEATKHMRDNIFASGEPRPMRGSFLKLLETGKITADYADEIALKDWIESVDDPTADPEES